MWQRSGASLFALVVLCIVVFEGAAMLTLAAAFVLHALGRVSDGDLNAAVVGALAVIGGSVAALAGYIVAFHLLASARERRWRDRVADWSSWWTELLHGRVREEPKALPREALDAFLQLREELARAPAERLAFLAERWGVAARLARGVSARGQVRRVRALQDLASARLTPALPAIVTALRDPEPLVRRHALRAAARTIAWIPAEVRQPEVELFARALREAALPSTLLAESLLLLESAAGEVIELLLGDPFVPQRVLQASLVAAGRRELRELADRVLPFADHGEPEIRAAALRALAGMGRLPPGGVAAVAARAEDEKPFVRVHAARAAALLPPELAIATLWRRLGDPSWWVRLAAAESLGHLGPSGHASLERAASTHPDRFARDMALQALSDLQWKAAA